MALSIIPKSEIRQVTSITQGYGEIPTVEKNGQLGFALPGKQITFDKQIAEHFLNTLDTTIRTNISRPLASNKPVIKTRVRHTPLATIVMGAGIVPLVKRGGHPCWLLPGGQTTQCERTAIRAARRMNHIIKTNTQKQARK